MNEKKKMKVELQRPEKRSMQSVKEGRVRNKAT
jgi:hypothetical protein